MQLQLPSWTSMASSLSHYGRDSTQWPETKGKIPPQCSPSVAVRKLSTKSNYQLLPSVGYSKRNFISSRFTLSPTQFISRMSGYCQSSCQILCHKCSVCHWVGPSATMDILENRKVSLSWSVIEAGFIGRRARRLATIPPEL